MTARQRWLMMLIVALAFVVRVWALDYKPMHFDEGVNGTLIDGMRTEGYYHYRPENFHGPLHFYALFASQQLFGRSVWSLRMPTVLINTASVALLFAFPRFLPFRALAIAALVMALSPAMIFYARYAIHESWLTFFTMLACLGVIGCAKQRSKGDVWALGLGLSGMVLTKETYALHCIAAGLALGCVWLLDLFAPEAVRVARNDRPNAASLFLPAQPATGEPAPEITDAPQTGWREVLRIGAVCAGIVVAFYSGFGMDWGGVAGLWETWTPMLHKGTATGPGTEQEHHKSVYYFANLLLDYEWPALLGLIASPLLVLPVRSRSLRFFALYGVATFIGYSLIPYKTPWCLLAMLPPLFIMTGWLAHRLCGFAGGGAVTVLLMVLLAQPTIDAWQLNFGAPGRTRINPVNDKHRYAYVQTTWDINKLLTPLKELERRDRMNRYLHGHVYGERFPLSWQLGDMPNVLFFDDDKSPENYDADFLLVPEDRVAEVEAQLLGVYYKMAYLPREYGTASWLYLASERFGSLVPTRTPEFHPRVRVEKTEAAQ